MGPAIARYLAVDPWHDLTIVADVNLDGAEAVAAAVRNDGGRAEAAVVDLTSVDSIEALSSRYANADKLVIAAGVIESPRSALEIDPAEFDRITAVNYRGVYFSAQRFAHRMAERGRGTIVAVSSVAATIPRVNRPAYSGSKAGLRLALRVLALEVVQAGVRINTVSPGVMTTTLSSKWSESNPGNDLSAGDLETYKMRIPQGGRTTPEQVASVIGFLLGPDSERVVMQDVVVDGGELLGV